MAPGDFVLTPFWTIHDHGNTSKKSMMWLDVLDVPTVNFFETCFYEHFEEEKQNTKRDTELADALWLGVLPDGTAGAEAARSSTIPTRGCGRSSSGSPAGDIDPRHGARFRYANPVTGGWVMPTMGAHLSLLPKGFKGKDYQSTDGTDLRLRRRRGLDQGRRQGVRVGAEGRLRRPVLDEVLPQRQEGIGAVLDLRPAGAGSARHLAGEDLGGELINTRAMSAFVGRERQ